MPKKTAPKSTGAISNGINKKSGVIMKYFVLKPSGTGLHALASRRAMGEYARTIEELDQKLAEDLSKWVKVESLKAIRERDKIKKFIKCSKCGQSLAGCEAKKQ